MASWKILAKESRELLVVEIAVRLWLPLRDIPKARQLTAVRGKYKLGGLLGFLWMKQQGTSRWSGIEPRELIIIILARISFGDRTIWIMRISV